MARYRKHVSFPGRIVMLGFGSIGQAMLPVLLRHIDIDPARVTIITRSPDRTGVAAEYGVPLLARPLREDDYEAVLDGQLREGDFLLNVSVEIESLALIRYCERRGILYLDTVIEPWPGRTEDPSLALSVRSNYGLREQVLDFRNAHRSGPTALITMGANPGLVSVFVKRALLNMASDNGLQLRQPARREDWAALARQLGIKVIHVAERDTQVSRQRKGRGEFVNTWSVNGFVGEGLQPSELGWGTHEGQFPADGLRHGYGCGAAIMLDRPGAATRVRSWTPLEGPYHGFLITHGESISIADHLTLRHEGGEVAYRPTVHYAYHPCDDAVLSLHELAGKQWKLQGKQRIMGRDTNAGMDELGVLLMGNPRGIYWYGSRLTIQKARRLAPHNTATSLQVVAGILAGLVWAIRNPRRGVVEPDDLEHEAAMEIASQYLGEMAGVYDGWTPLHGRTALFGDDVDARDPWQFKNFRVT